MSEEPKLDHGASPLTEADPASVDILMTERLTSIFNMSPTKFTDEDLDTVVKYYRAQRGKFLIDEANKANKPPRGTKAAATPKVTVPTLDTTQIEF